MENNAVADEARGCKKTHRRKIAALNKIKRLAGEMRVELVFFSAKESYKIKNLLTDLETVIAMETAKHEIGMETCKEIISAEAGSKLRAVEQMVAGHPL